MAEEIVSTFDGSSRCVDKADEDRVDNNNQDNTERVSDVKSKWFDRCWWMWDQVGGKLCISGKMLS